MTTRGKYAIALALNVAVLILAIPFGGPVTVPSIVACGFFAGVCVGALGGQASA